MPNPTVLWIGPAHRREFSDIYGGLREEGSTRQAAGISAADGAAAPDLVILAQSHPGQFTEASVVRLRESWPRARFVVLLGGWCDGETRTGSPLPDLPRITVGEWRNRREAMTWAVRGKRTGGGVPGGPGTGGNGELSPSAEVPRRLAAVYAPSACYRRALSDGLSAVGCRVAAALIDTPLHLQGLDLVLWEAATTRCECEHQIVELRRRHPSAKLIALVTFPREFEVDWFRAAGVSRVLAQPFDLDDLRVVVASVDRTAVSPAA